MMECPSCKTVNYLDPYAFWNFTGNTKCAGCDTVFYIKRRNGQTLEGPNAVNEEPDLLPGFAESPEFEPIVSEDKVRPGPKARPDFVGKPIPMTRNIRGNLVSGRPLTADELVGSRPRFILAGGEGE